MTTGAFPPPGSTKNWAGRAVTNARHWYATNHDTSRCARCGKAIAGQWHLGHKRDRQAYPHLTWEPSNWQAEHARCSQSAGARQGNKRRPKSAAKKQTRTNTKARPVSGVLTSRGPLLPVNLSPVSPGSPGKGSEAFAEPRDGAGWPRMCLDGLWGLSGPPVDATWPRFMSGPHPRAVGSYGPEFVAWAEARPGLHPKRTGGLRWFQKLIAYRMLEHDSDGLLVWEWVLATISRQQGKSWLMRALLMWALDQGERWGTQTVLSIAHKLQAASELWRPAARWVGTQEGWPRPRYANGQECIESPDGSRWLIAAANEGAGVSMSLNRVLVDEAWRIPAIIVDEYIHPTLAEATAPQLMLVSTAGDSSSELMRSKRAAAFAQLDAPVDTLIVEWSAPPGADVWDRGGWRAASGFWDERRRRVLEGAARQLLVGTEGSPPNVAAFKMQWLNQWVPMLMDVPPWLDEAAWSRARLGGMRPPEFAAVAAAVEDRYGRGGFAAVGWQDGEQVRVIAGEFDRLEDAWTWADTFAPDSWQVGAGLKHDPKAMERGAEPVGSAESAPALAKWRELVEAGSLSWDGDTLSENCPRLVVKDNDTRSGVQLVATAGVRSGGVRCGAWVAYVLSQRQVGALVGWQF